MSKPIKIFGLFAGHDSSCCMLENGKITTHLEFERFPPRIKEYQGDILQLANQYLPNWKRADYITSVPPKSKLTQYQNSWKQLEQSYKPILWYGHHTAHAANAFFSSPFEKALILSIDGGGMEAETDDGRSLVTATSMFAGKDIDIKPLKYFDITKSNIGMLWTRATRSIFRLNNGIGGHQAGTVQALADYAKNPSRFKNDFYQMLTHGPTHQRACEKPLGQPVGPYNEALEPRHPFLGHYRDIADKSFEDKADLAGGLQLATEQYVFELIRMLCKFYPDYDCLVGTGGVMLNSSMAGKIREAVPQIKKVFIPNCPYDGSMSMGSAQYHYHAVLRQPRIQYDENDCFSPYLGLDYSLNQIEEDIVKFPQLKRRNNVTDDEVLFTILNNKKIVAIHHGRSETGRRALGNRSIVCDPRNPDCKDIVNNKIKKRQNWRPFAPSLPIEFIDEWFEGAQDLNLDYMSFVLKFKEGKSQLVPGVAHINNTGRVQAVKKNANPWWHGFLMQWYARYGTPLLNTSFNDREPICETAFDSCNCFSKTDLDYLYFPEHGILLSK